MSQPILVTKQLVKEFGGFVAVDHVDLAIREGSIHALIGPNGAGKTTCFNLLTKFARPTSGSISYRGADVTGLGPDAVARLGLIRSFQISSIFPHLSVFENVRIALQRKRGSSLDFWRPERALRPYDAEAQRLLEEVGLAQFAEEDASQLSYGRRRALEIATTLALDPVVMLLDEPTAGMTQEDVARIVALIRRVREGRTVVIVEHNLSVVEDLCDTITVLVRGRVVAEGSYATVSGHPEVISAYLGADDE